MRTEAGYRVTDTDADSTIIGDRNDRNRFKVDIGPTLTGEEGYVTRCKELG